MEVTMGEQRNQRREQGRAAGKPSRGPAPARAVTPPAAPRRAGAPLPGERGHRGKPATPGSEARGRRDSSATPKGDQRERAAKPGGLAVEGGAPRKHPERTCVGCRRPGGRDDLFRLVEGPDGQIAVDARARAGGRGAWVHASRECIAQAAKRHAAERSLKVPVRDVDPAALAEGVRAALSRKVESLLTAARRTRTLAAGATAVAERLEAQPVPLVILALDAGENARKALGAGGEDFDRGGVAVRSYGSKGELGRLLGREGEVAVVAALEPRIAQELLSTIDRLAGLEG